MTANTETNVRKSSGKYMNITPEISLRLKVLSLFAAISVLLIHSTYFPVSYELPVSVLRIQDFLAYTWTGWAVPAFFVISGFLFGNGKDFDYALLLKKKSRTLLVPYLLWCIIGILTFMPIKMASNLVTHHGLLNETFLAGRNAFDVLNAAFGITVSGPMHNGPLWYVRTLLIIFIASPILIFLQHKMKWLLAIAAVLSCPFFSRETFTFAGVNLSAFSFFLFGMSIPFWGRRYKSSRWTFMASMILAIAFTALYFFRTGIPFYVSEHQVFLHFAMVSFVSWFMYESAVKIARNDTVRQAFLQFIPPSLPFVLYVFHGSTIKMVHAVLLTVFGHSLCASLLILIFIPVAYVLVTLLLIKFMEKFCPSFLALLCGGRG